MRDGSLWVRKLVADWNRCHGAFYQLRENDLTWHFHEQDWLSYFPLELAGVPLLCAEATEKGAARGVSAKTLWLSCQGRVPEEKLDSFVSELDQLAPSRGKTRLCLGGEEFHLIPGIPDSPEDGGLAAVSQKLECKFAEAVDYAGSLRTPAIEAFVGAAWEGARLADFSLEMVSSEKELNELGLYLEGEFRGRWEREFRFWREREDTKRAIWNVLRRGGEIRGFARLAIRGSGVGGWLPGALRFPLAAGSVDSPKDASLGPIGISASERGKGAGKVLLGLALQLLLARGAERLCIDWTNAYNYYKPLGLQVVRKYRSALKDY